MLGYNKIKDISPLNQYKSENIRVLAFIGNLIEDISPLEKINAPNLEQINIWEKRPRIEHQNQSERDNGNNYTI